MEKRQLGASGLAIAPLVFGGNVLGWTAEEARSFELLDAFVAGGYNAIDTADVYSRWAPGHSGGESEAIIGRWLKRRGRRQDVAILTKVGMEMGPGRKGLKRAYILESVEGSLKRLGTDYIDLYQSHKDDPDTPIEETLRAYEDLVKAGKVRAIGASNYSAERLAASLDLAERHGLPRYQSLQPDYSLMEREEFEAGPAALCKARKVGVITYFSLASGFLSGKYRSEADLGKSVRGGNMKKYLNPRGLGILAALDGVAGRHRATPAQVALAWLQGRPGVTAPIASATTIAQLEEIMGAARLRLAAADEAELDKASA